MPRILLVKTSSLGDVVHNFPVVSDIVSAIPGVEVDWVVEERFAALPALHPGVRRTIPVAVRRWRARLYSAATWREMRAFASELRAPRYDAVVDSQGLFKSAIVARIARGKRYGLGWRASREPLFPFYHRTFDVPYALHAVERNRSLASQALAYTPAAAVDYGIGALAGEFGWLPRNVYAVLMHATSARAKLWPEENWIALGRALADQGIRSVFPWGSDRERGRSERLVAGVADSVVPPRLALADAASLLAGARCAVGVDTGLTHLAGALGVATVGIYVSTDPAATGLYGCARAANVGKASARPEVEAVLRELNRLCA
jgi:heptosyltransferase-1